MESAAAEKNEKPQSLLMKWNQLFYGDVDVLVLFIT